MAYFVNRFCIALSEMVEPGRLRRTKAANSASLAWGATDRKATASRVGVGVTFGEAWHVRLDLQTVTIDEDVLNSDDDASVDSFLLELQYRIGAHRASIRPSAPPTATP